MVEVAANAITAATALVGGKFKQVDSATTYLQPFAFLSEDLSFKLKADIACTAAPTFPFSFITGKKTNLNFI